MRFYNLYFSSEENVVSVSRSVSRIANEKEPTTKKVQKPKPRSKSKSASKNSNKEEESVPDVPKPKIPRSGAGLLWLGAFACLAGAAAFHFYPVIKPIIFNQQ